MTQALDAHQQDLVTRLNYFTNWKDKYKYIIDLGKQLAPFPEALKTEENRIHGCQSQVWISIEEQDGKLQMQATSDAAIVSGLIAILLRVYNDHTPEQIINTPLDFLATTGLLQHLSPNRSTGLYHMIKRIQAEAQARV
ncbi:SufE family protein [Thiomicrospira sp. ALE5]|uniref:SufE family protein n=1 Tax=Thiomicrospira sp. ALE5 TaxID=748650 RepID=UPI0008EBE815|nr:SufE family protein [Thiomicrospira sp. ALE5]SFR53108.1 cysteine desulfuration protein SufE [Thiomicrospira sp. ALE5]